MLVFHFLQKPTLNCEHSSLKQFELGQMPNQLCLLVKIYTKPYFLELGFLTPQAILE